MSNVKLLPLPMPKMDAAKGGLDWTDDEMTDYALDCVAHATAAKDAEIEALRRDRDDCLAAREHYASLYGEQHGRAELLAEALWTRAQTWENEGIRLNGGSDKPYSDDENSIRAFVLGCCSDDLKAILRDVLRPTAEQGGK